MGTSTRAEPADEVALLTRLAGRDTAAFALLYDRHAPAIFGYAVRLLGNAGMAELAVQEAFLSLWRQAPTLAPGTAGVRAWLLLATRGAATQSEQGAGIGAASRRPARVTRALI